MSLNAGFKSHNAHYEIKLNSTAQHSGESYPDRTAIIKTNRQCSAHHHKNHCVKKNPSFEMQMYVINATCCVCT